MMVAGAERQNVMSRLSRTLPVMLGVLALSCLRQSPENQNIPLPGSGVVCTDILVAGLVVEVRDATTSEPAAFGARGEIRDGSYVEMLQVEGGGTVDPATALRLVGAWERPGVYSVVVRKEGYRDWTVSGVLVEADACHVLRVTLRAALERNI
jgi:6,7-dimethyl-8-ribityllumazine synthase